MTTKQKHTDPENDPHENTTDEKPMSGSATSKLILASAQDALSESLDKLPQEVVQWGQTLVGSLVMSATPVRRTLKTQPVLTGVGLGAIALGGILVGVALTRDSHGKRRN